MENQVNKKSTIQQSTELLATLKDTNLSREFERNLTVEKIVKDSIPLVTLAKNCEPGIIEATLDVHLNNLVESLNLKWNLQPHQIKTIVEDLIDKYQYESLEDFILIFKRARQGEFGELYRLDSAVIFGWMERYLEEKYEAFERLQKQNKPAEKIIFPEVSEETVKEVKDFAEGLKKTMKKEVPISDEEIEAEGQERASLPKSKSAGYVSAVTTEAHELHIQWIRENLFMDGTKRPEFMEEETWLKKNR